MSLIGDQLLKSDKINQLIKDLANETEKNNASISGIKEATSSLKESYKQLMENTAKFRGRPLQYPYIGSGAGKGR